MVNDGHVLFIWCSAFLSLSLHYFKLICKIKMSKFDLISILKFHKALVMTPRGTIFYHQLHFMKSIMSHNLVHNFLLICPFPASSLWPLLCSCFRVRFRKRNELLSYNLIESNSSENRLSVTYVSMCTLALLVCKNGTKRVGYPSLMFMSSRC